MPIAREGYADPAPLLTLPPDTFPGDASHDEIAQHQAERAAQQSWIDKVNANPDQARLVATNVGAWASAAPMLPSQMLVNLAQAGITPDSAAGAWIIKTGVPAFGSKRKTKNDLTEGDAAMNLLADPGRLQDLQKLSLEQQQRVFEKGSPEVGSLTAEQLDRLARSGHEDPHHPWWNRVGDVATTAAQGVMTGLSAGAEGLAANIRRGVGAELSAGSDIVHGHFGEAGKTLGRIGAASATSSPLAAPSSPLFPDVKQGEYEIPHINLGGLGFVSNVSTDALQKSVGGTPDENKSPSVGVGTSTYTVGPSVNDIPSQITAVQALRGKDLGSGFFPAGPAHEAAVREQKLAVSVNGHALTPGRSLAATVFTPGTKPYQIMSGAVDFGVAMEADPSAVLLKELSSGVSGARMFAPTTEDAVRTAAQHLIDSAHTPAQMTALQETFINSRYSGAIARGNADLTEAIMDGLKANPTSALDMAAHNPAWSPEEIMGAIGRRHAGVLSGVRDAIHPKDALTWINSPVGQKVAKKIADPKTTGYDVWAKSGHKMPVSVAWDLAKSTDASEVAAKLGQHLASDVTAAPFRFTRTLQDLRMFAKMPNYGVNALDNEAMVRRGLQELQLAKVPRGEWDNYLKPLALSGDKGTSAAAWFKLGNRLGDQILMGDTKPVGQFVNTVGNKVLRNGPSFQDQLQRLNGLAKEKKAFERLNGPDASWEDAAPQKFREWSRVGAEVRDRQQRARKMATYFQSKTDDQTQLWTDDMGNTPHVPGLSVDGEAVPVTGPYGESELLNQTVPVIGGDGVNGLRNIKRAVSIAEPLYANKLIGPTLRGTTYALDHLTGVWKTMNLLAPRIVMRYLSDEMGRAATAGLDSAFKNPMGYLAYVTGRKGSTDINLDNFFDDFSNYADSARRAVGRQASLASELFDTDKYLAKGWGTVSRDHPEFESAWADRISRAHIDRIGRPVAQAMVGDGDLTALKQSFFDGSLSKTRQDLIDANLKWGSKNLVNRAASDAYVDGWQQRILDVSANRHDIIDAIATGEPFKTGAISRDFTKTLREYAHTGQAPEKVVGPVFDNSVQAVGRTKQVTNMMFSMMMDRPTRELLRSPSFKQLYWKRLDELQPFMDDTTLAQLRSVAAENNITLATRPTDVLKRVPINANHADIAAKSFALQSMHDLLYYPGARSNLMDGLRNLIPFGEAWKNIISTWAKLTVEHPVVVRRVEQGVTEARQSGFFHPNNETGEEMFTMIPGSIMKHLPGGVPFPMEAPVKGLNIVGEGLPGLGPALQIPAGAILSKLPDSAAKFWVQQHIQPYGAPDASSGLVETFYPGWLNKVRSTGWFNSVPGLGQSPNQKRVLNGVMLDVSNYLISTGQYDVTNQAGLDKLHKDAMHDAQMLYLWRGMAQFSAPAAPNYVPTVLAQHTGPVYITGGGAQKDVRGLVKPGNLDLYDRPIVKNADGSISTVRTISVGTDDGEVLLPTVIDNRVVSNQEAIAHYRSTGENLGVFKSRADADAYSERLHNDQAELYAKGKPPKDGPMPGGQLLEQWMVAQDYRKMLDAHQGDSYPATLEFINKYGRNMLFTSQPQSRPTVFGSPTTAEGAIWRSDHEQFADTYKDVYGYWVPSGGQFSYPAYLDGIKRGEREPLTLNEWAALAQARVGNAIYDNLRSKFPPNPTQEQRNWLTDAKVKIAEQYPGFNNDKVQTPRLALDQTVDQLRQAVEDHSVGNGPLSSAIKTYIGYRDRALDEARSRTGSHGSTLNGERMADLRGWLNDVGGKLVAKTPAFSTIWDDLFAREVDPNG